MYSLHDYSRMIVDETRVGAYVRALEAVVRPGSVVADVGAGTGLFALLACRLGARRVYAIDTNGAIALGPELAHENGYSDRIVFFHRDAREVELPEPADVIVSDLRGALPFCGDHLAVLSDVRRRFLKPGGVLIPCCDHLRVAVVESPRLHEWATGPSDGPLGLRLDGLRARLTNASCRDRVTEPLLPSHILSTITTWATLEYASASVAPVAGEAELRVERAGIGHGLALWFDAFLTEEIGFSTGPGHELCYGRLFLPWPSPVVLSKGDDVRVNLWSQPQGSPWGWNTSVHSSSTGRTIQSFKQSDFLSWPENPSPPAARQAIAKDALRGHSVDPR
ncbi:MAG: class I SAM-dependent methyltransferase [Myxococcales bacterium]|nr:class I SAM-dependent methyltransferase [Myxococcales bacterium]